MNAVLILALALGQADVFEWRPFKDGDKSQVMLWRDGRQLGVWHYTKPDGGGFWVADVLTGKFTVNVDLPIGCPWPPGHQPPMGPPAPATPKPDFETTGVDMEQVSKKERHVFTGQEVSAVESQQLIGQVPDDALKLRLTVLGGTPAERLKVLSDIENHKSLREVKAAVLVQSYPVNHWSVEQVGFVTTGTPTIYIQSPAGKVLYRTDSYEGPEKLAQAYAEAVGAIRKPVPDYDPKKDPDGKPIGLPDFLKGVPPWALVGGGFLLLILLTERKVKGGP